MNTIYMYTCNNSIVMIFLDMDAIYKMQHCEKHIEVIPNMFVICAISLHRAHSIFYY